MPIAMIKVYVTLLDAQSVRHILEKDPSQINYTGMYGDSLLYSLVHNFDYSNPQELKKAQDTLDVLFEYGVNPTVKTKVKPYFTAKESAQHLDKPQELIDMLEAYEKSWHEKQAKHTAATLQPTSDLRKRHNRAQGGGSSATANYSSGDVSMQLHQ